MRIGRCQIAACCLAWSAHAQATRVDPRTAIQKLSHPDERTRGAAVGVLVAAGRASLPLLEQALGHEEPRVQAHAAWASGELGAEARTLVPALVRLLTAKSTTPEDLRDLSTPYPPTRSLAAWALGRIGAEAGAAVAALAAALGGPDPVLAAAAADALSRLGPPAAPQLTALRDRVASEPSPVLRLTFAVALARSGPEGTARLVGLLDDPTAAACHEAVACALGEARPDAVALAALIQAAARDGAAHVPVREAAVLALGRTRADDPATLQALARALMDPWSDVAHPALVGVAMRPEAARLCVVEIVAGFLTAVQVAERCAAVGALGRLTRLPRVPMANADMWEDVTPYEPAIAALCTAFRDPIPQVRAALLASMLALHDPRVRAARELLAKDPDPKVREQATLALRHSVKPATPSIAQLCDDLVGGNPDARGMALWHLGTLGPTAAPSVPQLLRLLEVDDDAVRSGAIDVLCEAAPGVVPAAAAVPVLMRSLERTEETRLHELECHALALAAFGAAAAPATRALLRLLDAGQPLPRDENDREELGTLNLRCAAASALAAIGPGATAAVPALIQVLEHEGYRLLRLPVPGYQPETWLARPMSVQFHGDRSHHPRLADRTLHLAALCCGALAAIGPQARTAIPVLEQRARDGQGFGTRAAAQAALLALRGK